MEREFWEVKIITCTDVKNITVLAEGGTVIQNNLHTVDKRLLVSTQRNVATIIRYSAGERIFNWMCEAKTRLDIQINVTERLGLLDAWYLGKNNSYESKIRLTLTASRIESELKLDNTLPLSRRVGLFGCESCTMCLKIRSEETFSRCGSGAERSTFQRGTPQPPTEVSRIDGTIN